jgi:NAD(P)-dependent dehydrogenase (short-subunit alcohol dehydrogenase family)
MSAIVITGSTRGIGTALARHFLGKGRLVTGIDVGPPAASLAVAEGYEHQVADVTDEMRLEQAIDAAWSREGVSAVFANAAVTDIEHRRAIDLPYSDWRRVLHTNVDGAFLTGRLAARRMAQQGHGSIVFITSSLAKLDQAIPGDAPYSASKAAVEMFAKVLSLELAGSGVNVNTLFPSAKIDTGFFAHLPQTERQALARPDILNRAAAFLADLPKGILTGQSVDQQRFDEDAAYRASLGAMA